MLIDSHCHLDRLDLSKHNGNLDEAIEAAKQKGVHHFLCVSIDLESYPKMRALVDDFPQVSVSVGVHPNEDPSLSPSLEQLVTLAEDDSRIVAIGETGLDYYRSEGESDWQIDRFFTHIEAAKITSKPLIVHSRSAKQDTIGILKEGGADQVGGVMHCFAEDWEMAKQALDLNFYISFSGIVTFKNAKELQDVACKVPLDRILIETDSPYLAPVPYRGKPNEPAYVYHVAEKIAQLRGLSVEMVGQTTSKNYLNLFGGNGSDMNIKQ